MKRFLGLLLSFCLVVINTALPAGADYSLLTSTGSPTPYFVLSGLTGQSACSVSLRGTLSGTYAIEGIYQSSQSWTPALLVAAPDGTTTTASITTAGSYIFNCASMIGIRVDATAGGQTAITTLNAGGGVGRTIGSGVNGGKTNVVGAGPITVTNSGNTATVNCTGCTGGATATPVAVIPNSANVAVATPSPGVFAVSVTPPVISGTGGATVTNPSFNTFVVNSATAAPAATPVSVQPGNNVSVATPSAGVFVVSASTAAPPNITGINGTTVSTPAPNTFVISSATAAPAPTPFITSGPGIAVATPSANNYVISNTGSGPITAGNDINPITSNTAPVVAVTNSPTFTGVVTVGGVGTGSITSAYALGSQGVGGLTYFAASPSGNPYGNVAGITGSALTINSQQLYPYAAMDTNGNWGFEGSLASGTLTPGNCLQAGTNGIIQTTSSACGGGTTTGITPGVNIAVSTPNPAMPTVSVVNNPTFTGRVTGNNANTGDFAFYTGQNNYVRSYSAQNTVSSSGNSNLGPNPAATVAGVIANIWDFSNYNGNTSVGDLAALDSNGDLGTLGYLASGTLTPGNCLQATTSGKIVSTTSACASGSGSVSSVTGTGNISTTNPTTTPVVTITAAPTFAGNVTQNQVLQTAPIATLGSGCVSNTLFLAGVYTPMGSGYSCSSSTSASFAIPAVGSTVSVPITAGFAIHKQNVPLTISDGTNSISGNTTTATTATSTSISFIVQRVNVGASGNTMAAGAEVADGGYDAGASNPVAVSSPIQNTGTASSPIITCGTCALTGGTPSFSTITATNGIQGYQFPTSIKGCVVSTGNALQANPYPCVPAVGASFNIPAVGSTVAVLVSSASYALTMIAGTPLTILNSTDSISGVTTSTVTNGSTFSFKVLAINLGAVGDTMLVGTQIYSGSTPNVTSFLNGTAQTGYMNIQQWNNAPTIATGASRTYTFDTNRPYVNVPVCQAGQSAAGGGLAPAGMYISAISTASVTVSNGTGATQQAFVSCIGI